jgi:hypothetical protein
MITGWLSACIDIRNALKVGSLKGATWFRFHHGPIPILSPTSEQIGLLLEQIDIERLSGGANEVKRSVKNAAIHCEAALMGLAYSGRSDPESPFFRVSIVLFMYCLILIAPAANRN